MRPGLRAKRNGAQAPVCKTKQRSMTVKGTWKKKGKNINQTKKKGHINVQDTATEVTDASKCSSSKIKGHVNVQDTTTEVADLSKGSSSIIKGHVNVQDTTTEVADISKGSSSKIKGHVNVQDTTTEVADVSKCSSKISPLIPNDDNKLGSTNEMLTKAFSTVSKIDSLNVATDKPVRKAAMKSIINMKKFTTKCQRRRSYREIEMDSDSSSSDLDRNFSDVEESSLVIDVPPLDDSEETDEMELPQLSSIAKIDMSDDVSFNFASMEAKLKEMLQNLSEVPAIYDGLTRQEVKKKLAILNKKIVSHVFDYQSVLMARFQQVSNISLAAFNDQTCSRERIQMKRQASSSINTREMAFSEQCIGKDKFGCEKYVQNIGGLLRKQLLAEANDGRQRLPGFRFKKSQYIFLETWFLNNNVPMALDQRCISLHLMIPYDSVRTWFQNRRALIEGIPRGKLTAKDESRDMHYPSASDATNSVGDCHHCTQCQSSFISFFLYKNHLAEHIKSTLHCTVCQMAFTHQILLDTHLILRCSPEAEARLAQLCYEDGNSDHENTWRVKDKEQDVHSLLNTNVDQEPVAMPNLSLAIGQDAPVATCNNVKPAAAAIVEEAVASEAIKIVSDFNTEAVVTKSSDEANITSTISAVAVKSTKPMLVTLVDVDNDTPINPNKPKRHIGVSVLHLGQPSLDPIFIEPISLPTVIGSLEAPRQETMQEQIQEILCRVNNVNNEDTLFASSASTESLYHCDDLADSVASVRPLQMKGKNLKLFPYLADSQVDNFKLHFVYCNEPSTKLLQMLAKVCGISDHVVKYWFQSARTRARKTARDNANNAKMMNHHRRYCTECQMSFFTLGYLLRHYIKHIPTAGSTMICPVCEKDIASLMLIDHIEKVHYIQRVHLESVQILNLQCHLCQLQCEDPAILLIHKLNHFPTSKQDIDNQRSLGCALCRTTFVSIYCLDEHMALHQQHQWSHKCHLCTDSFPDPRLLETHILLHEMHDQLGMNHHVEIAELSEPNIAEDSSSVEEIDTEDSANLEDGPVITNVVSLSSNNKCLSGGIGQFSADLKSQNVQKKCENSNGNSSGLLPHTSNMVRLIPVNLLQNENDTVNSLLPSSGTPKMLKLVPVMDNSKLGSSELMTPGGQTSSNILHMTFSDICEGGLQTLPQLITIPDFTEKENSPNNNISLISVVSDVNKETAVKEFTLSPKPLNDMKIWIKQELRDVIDDRRNTVTSIVAENHLANAAPVVSQSGGMLHCPSFPNQINPHGMGGFINISQYRPAVSGCETVVPTVADLQREIFGHKRRKTPASFTEDERQVLEAHFLHDNFPANSVMTAIGSRLSKGMPVIKTWFQNTRKWARRQRTEKDDALQLVYHCQCCKSSFVSNALLQAHSLSHENDKAFQCHGCETAILNDSVLVTHNMANPNCGEKNSGIEWSLNIPQKVSNNFEENLIFKEDVKNEHIKAEDTIYVANENEHILTSSTHASASLWIGSEEEDLPVLKIEEENEDYANDPKMSVECLLRDALNSSGKCKFSKKKRSKHKTLTCCVCNKHFYALSQLQMHNLKCIKPDGPSFVDESSLATEYPQCVRCVGCHRWFSDQDNFLDHITDGSVRKRQTYTPADQTVLCIHFLHNNFPVSKEVALLAKRLGLQAKQIGIWFANKRSKQRKVLPSPSVPLDCMRCKTTFVDSSNLAAHQHLFHEQFPVRYYACTQGGCKSVFLHSELLLTHQMNHTSSVHDVETTVSGATNLRVSSKSVVETEIPASCVEVLNAHFRNNNFPFSHEVDLLSRRLHIDSDIINKWFQDRQKKFSDDPGCQTLKRTSKQCQSCKASFLFDLHRILHEQMHSSHVAKVCRLCGATFSSSLVLETHQFSHVKSTAREHPLQSSGKGQSLRAIPAKIKVIGKSALTHKPKTKAELPSHPRPIMPAPEFLESPSFVTNKGCARVGSFLIKVLEDHFSNSHFLLPGEALLLSMRLKMSIEKILSWYSNRQTAQLSLARGAAAEPVTCQYCDCRFLFDHHYKIHCEKHKSGIVHQCIQCGEAFFSQIVLETHKFLHTKELADGVGVLEEDANGKKMEADEMDKQLVVDFKDKKEVVDPTAKNLVTGMANKKLMMNEADKKLVMGAEGECLGSSVAEHAGLLGKTGKRRKMNRNVKMTNFDFSEMHQNNCDINEEVLNVGEKQDEEDKVQNNAVRKEPCDRTKRKLPTNRIVTDGDQTSDSTKDLRNQKKPRTETQECVVENEEILEFFEKRQDDKELSGTSKQSLLDVSKTKILAVLLTKEQRISKGKSENLSFISTENLNGNESSHISENETKTSANPDENKRALKENAFAKPDENVHILSTKPMRLQLKVFQNISSANKGQSSTIAADSMLKNMNIQHPSKIKCNDLSKVATEQNIVNSAVSDFRIIASKTTERIFPETFGPKIGKVIIPKTNLQAPGLQKSAIQETKAKTPELQPMLETYQLPQATRPVPGLKIVQPISCLEQPTLPTLPDLLCLESDSDLTSDDEEPSLEIISMSAVME